MFILDIHWYLLRLSQIQHENLSLKQQLETLKLSSVRDANNDPHDKYNTMILNLRAESEQVCMLWDIS